MTWKLLVAATLLLLPALQQAEPTVRIGLGQNSATVSVRSSEEFRIQGQATRTARFSSILALGEASEGTVLNREQLRYRMAIELDGSRYVVVPMTNRIRIQPSSPTARLCRCVLPASSKMWSSA